MIATEQHRYRNKSILYFIISFSHDEYQMLDRIFFSKQNANEFVLIFFSLLLQLNGQLDAFKKPYLHKLMLN